MSQIEVKGLFPTPFMKVARALPPDLVRRCVDHVLSEDTRRNAYSELLRHTDLADAAASDLHRAVEQAVSPRLVDFGTLLFGEALDWHLKEIWINLLESGGHQAIHTHANSFISGIVYLTESHASARTVFHRSVGGREFIFSNDNPHAQMGAFNGNKWLAPRMQPGDMALYPSYLLHEVPRNEGARRITMAFNAIPDRLDTWGYSVRFSSHKSSDQPSS